MQNGAPNEDKHVIVGRFGSSYGVRGWIKVISFTDPKENILAYQPWFVNYQGNYQQIHITGGKEHGQFIIVKFAECDDPETAKTFTNVLILVPRAQLSKPTQGHYYWADLEGLTVINKQQETLGIIDHLFATGANDVIVVKGDKERLIPYIKDVVLNVDLDTKVMRVDWDADF